MLLHQRNRRFTAGRTDFDPARSLWCRHVEALAEAKDGCVELQCLALVANGYADGADAGDACGAIVGVWHFVVFRSVAGTGSALAAVHQRARGRQELTRLQPGLQTRKDHRPAAVELIVGALAELVVGKNEAA